MKVRFTNTHRFIALYLLLRFLVYTAVVYLIASFLILEWLNPVELFYDLQGRWAILAYLVMGLIVTFGARE